MFFGDADESENAVIDDVHVIGLDPFGSEQKSMVVIDLLDAEDINKDEIGIARYAHVAPDLPVIVILVFEEAAGNSDFRLHAFIDFGDTLLLDIANAGRLDVDLVGQRGQSQDAPGCAIIFMLVEEDRFAAADDSIVLTQALIHWSVVVHW